MSEIASVSIEIEGVPGVWGWGELPAGGPSSWVAGALAVIPAPSRESADPETGALGTSRLSIELNATAAARRLLLYVPPDPVARLTTDRTAVQTTLTLAPALSPAPAVGARLYLAGETVTVTGGTALAPNVTRASDGSTARAWREGDAVWRVPPYWRRRIVTLKTWPSGAVAWRGLLDAPPRTSQDSARIVLEASGPQTLARDLVVGGDRRRIVLEPGARWVRWQGPHAGKASPTRIALQVGETLVSALQSSISIYQWTPQDVLLAAPELPPRSERVEAIEVLLVSPQAPTAAPTASHPHPYHPLTIATALLASRAHTVLPDPTIYDLLGPQWSAGLAPFFTSASFAAIDDLIAQTRWVAVDHVLLGWDGAAIRPIQAALDLALAYGFVLGALPDGALVWRQAPRVPVIDEALATLSPLRDRVEWETPRGGVADTVTAQIGALPWRAPSTISLTVQSVQGSYPTQGETARLDLSSLSAGRGDAAAARVLSAALRRYRGQPTLRLRVADVERPAIGEVYRLAAITGLQTPIFPRPDGTLTTDLTQDAYVGQCVARRWLVREGAWEIDLRLTAWPQDGLLRRRAPALRIASLTSTTITADADNWGQAGATPAADFTQGQLVRLWSASGVRKSATAEVTGVAATTITIDTDWTTDAVAGDVVRLVDLSAWVATPRVWVWLGAADRYA